MVASKPAERLRLKAGAEAMLIEELPILPVFYTRAHLIHPTLRVWHPNLHSLYNLAGAWFEPAQAFSQRN